MANLRSLENFQAELKRLGHYRTEYSNIEGLQRHFSEQLETLLPKLIKSQQQIPQILYTSQTEQIIQLEKQFQESNDKLQLEQDKLREKDSILVSLQDQLNHQSVRNVYFTKLRDLLSEGKWQKADEETTQIMLKIANQVIQGYLTNSDIDNFPCEDLQAVDQLWMEYSNNKFGFSVQRDIAMEERNLERLETWKNFCYRVGWYRNGMGNIAGWLHTSRLRSEFSNSLGHFPTVLLDYDHKKDGICFHLLLEKDW